MIRGFTTATIVVLVLVGVFPSLCRVEAADKAPSGQFSVSVDCETFPERGAFLCTAVVSDLSTGEDLLAAQLNGRLTDTVSSLQRTPSHVECIASRRPAAAGNAFATPAHGRT